MDFFSSSIDGRAVSQTELERLYERVRLIGGKGSRRDARLCVMTLVALLAGERHTDAPATASPVVRQFAIMLNDGMPDDERQRLKLFAPRIIGTRDALDVDRVELLRTALYDEIAPQLRRDGIDPIGHRRLGRDLSAYGAGCTDDNHCLRGGYLDEWRNDKRVASHRIGAEVARLLVHCAAEAAPSASRPWYWMEGIDLLDRLCDVGNTDCGIAVGTDQLARAESALDASRRFGGFPRLIASAIGELKLRLRHTPPKPAGGPGKPEPALRIGLNLHWRWHRVSANVGAQPWPRRAVPDALISDCPPPSPRSVELSTNSRETLSRSERLMLLRKLARNVRIGSLAVRGLAGSDLVFGQSDGRRPDLDVAIRLRGRTTAWQVARRPGLYLGEAYMNGSLVIERGSLRSFLELCFINFRAQGGRQGWLREAAHRALQHLQQCNPHRAARRNAAHHYDLSGELYRLFLDGDRQYSCAYFPVPDMGLEEAQRAKKAHIARKLLLEKGQRVLDIGCGWGGLALSLAREGAGQVTGITLSGEQLEAARQRAEEAGLDNRVAFELRDYRDVAGPFERIVSVGMFEHVGTPDYQTFFDAVARLLTDDGVALLHSIGRMDGPGSTNAWIRKYIFPGGYVPALSEVLPAIERAGLWVTDIEIWRLHYADTLRHWQERFAKHRAEVARIYDERFCRMWEFYLAASEMGFRYDHLMVSQIQLAKRVETVPLTRNYRYPGTNILSFSRVAFDHAGQALGQAAD